MRKLLVSMLLIILAAALYMSTIGGDNGAKEMIRQSGQRASEAIMRMDP